MKTRNISLPTELDEVILGYVQSGMYGNYSEVVRNAVRLMRSADEERALRLEAQRRDLGISVAQAEAGMLSPFDPNKIKQGGGKPTPKGDGSG